MSTQGIGEKLRMTREKAGLSQRELARRTGVSPSMIYQLEKGTRSPSVRTLEKILPTLGISMDSLMSKPAVAADELPTDESTRYVVKTMAKMTLREREEVRDFVRFLSVRGTSRDR